MANHKKLSRVEFRKIVKIKVDKTIWLLYEVKLCKLTSTKLQSIDIDLRTVVSLHKALILYVSSMRDMYDVYETKAKLK